eukprot:1364958-Pyramimonas_sp.AAC.1
MGRSRTLFHLSYSSNAPNREITRDRHNGQGHAFSAARGLQCVGKRDTKPDVPEDIAEKYPGYTCTTYDLRSQMNISAINPCTQH